MKTVEWKKVVRPLLPPGQSWAFRGRLCYRQPVDWVLTGVLGEGSGFHTGVYVWQVSMPLFVPSDVVTLSFSSRVGGRSRFYGMDEPAAMQQAVSEALAAALKPEPLQAIASRLVTKNASLFEARAYARILLGDPEAASADLRIAAASRVTAPWVQEIVDRANLMAGLLESGSPADAVHQLGRWRDDTCAALGIKRTTEGRPADPGR